MTLPGRSQKLELGVLNEESECILRNVVEELLVK